MTMRHTGATLSPARTAGTNFTITSNNGVAAFEIFEPS